MMHVTSFLAIAVQLVVLHRVDGGEVDINPSQVTSLHATAAAVGQRNKLLTHEVRCVVGMTDGKFISVIEPCDVVKKLLEDGRRD